MATTFAICAVFVPVAFMGGIIGKFFYPFGITVVVAVLVSLFVSFTLDPMLSSVWHDPPAERMKRVWGLGHAIRATDAGMDWLHRVYEKTICWAFSGRRYRVFVPPLPASVGSRCNPASASRFARKSAMALLIASRLPVLASRAICGVP